MDSEIWPWFSFALAIVAIALILLFLLERERRKPLGEETAGPVKSEIRFGPPFPTKRTITTDMFKEARDKLRILELEREILSYAIRRLYEASAEGKITEEERDKLALRYREDLARIKEEMARGESIVALDELERMQEEFVRLFSERFEELTKRIEEVRAISGYATAKTEAPTVEERLVEPEGPAEIEKKEERAEAPKHPGEEEALPKVEKKVSKPKAPSEPEKSEAERKIEQIVAEVEKVLKRLGQMEVEE